MELLSIGCTSVPCHHFANLNWKVGDNSLSLKNSKLFPRRKTGIFCVAPKPSWGLGNSHQDSDKVENLYQKEGIRLLSLLEGLRNRANAEITTENHNYYVTDGKVDLRHIPEKVDEVAKVLIPGLPDDDSEENPGSPICSCFWEWKPQLPVHYEKSGLENVQAPNVLFLPGFGVGSFHYEKQLKDLSRDYKVWALDFLGQGLSLPSEDPAPSDKPGESTEQRDAMWGFGEVSEPWAQDLVYSVDLWRDQVKQFIEQVIGEPVYVVGNSLGGFVALYFAACNPELVKGVTLLNATPFWGFLPNLTRSPRLSKLFPWAGTFPLPSSVRKLTEFIWQKVSDPGSILELIKQVYADPSTKVDKVFSRIVETTQHPAAAASLASIMFAPRAQLSFQEALSRCQTQDVRICLMYGKEDPWIRPIWGLKVKKQLPEVPYYEIIPAGHCPHDEVPEVVNFLLRGWIKNLESKGSISLPLLEEPDNVQDGIFRELEFAREGSRRSVKVRFFGSKISVWNLIGSFLRSSVANLPLKSSVANSR
ncbi:pheophytinase, chloroplastic [Elaeis guineensis]|uniref:Pheophytinase, chloroplastic n=1 Tax=Elaeis guineensis var. tenera TaxID=51953 RepID=A0A6I9S128_ELAGV|nr:pheophytinase, chloroplastic [Elaeis guineensis]XP_010931561.1 pheophytinase, chloroplastic [Elaeis guineensis]XP_010931562.1 pheophytinase, chloroplastic [Elaeis guineensis]